MKNLIEIARITNKKRVKKIEIFDAHNLEHRDSMFNQFYLALQENKFRNDLEAAALLYDSPPSDPRYRQLKSRFRRRLLNTLFFLDVNTPQDGSYEQAFYNCNREWAQLRILQSYGADDSAAKLARQLLTTALKYRFSDLVIGCSRILSDYASRAGNSKDFELCQEHLQTHTDLLQAEMKSEALYQRAVMIYQADNPWEDQRDIQLETYGNELLLLSEQFHSPTLSLHTFFVWIMYFELQKDYGGVLEVIDQAESYFKENPDFFQISPAIQIYSRKMSAYLHENNYKKGQITAEKYLRAIPEEEPRWFEFMEYYLLLSLHTGNYVSAVAILSRVTAHQQYPKLPAVESEKWLLYEGYMHYLLTLSPETPMLPRPKREPKQITQLLERPFPEVRDKRPFNFHLSLLRLLQQLSKGRANNIRHQIEEIYTFTLSYLRKDYFFRHNQLARLLHQLNKAGLQPNQLSNTEKYEDRLRERPFFYRGKLYELEPLPLEKIWQLILDHLR